MLGKKLQEKEKLKIKRKLTTTKKERYYEHGIDSSPEGDGIFYYHRDICFVIFLCFHERGYSYEYEGNKAEIYFFGYGINDDVFAF